MSPEGEINKGGEVAGDAKVEMIPKAEFESLKTSHETSTKELAKTKKELEEARLATLDPSYLEYLESSKPGARKAEAISTGNVDIDNMSRKEFAAYIQRGVVEAIAPAVQKEINSVKTSVQDVMARNELKEAEKKYPDFWDYKEDMIRLTKANDKYTIDDAYKIAKQNSLHEKTLAEQEAAAKAASEKPGGVSTGAVAPKDYKSKDEAATAAWRETMGDATTL